MTDPFRVLHVDDDPDLAEVAATFVERESERLTVETATSAADALERLDEREFDCVVSDYDMPGTDGIELLEAVRESCPDLPFILFTGKGSEEIASEAISAGVTDYLQKESGTDQYAVLANRVENAVERARAERERQRHLDAIETAREGISIVHPDGYYLYVNEAYADIYGYDPEEMIGADKELVYPDDTSFTEDVLPVVRADGRVQTEATGRRADGSTFPVEHTIANSETGALVCTARDLADRTERRRELERVEARFRALAENTTFAVVTIDDESTIRYANDAVADVFGYEPDELVGESLLRLMPERFREDHCEAVARYLREGDRRLDWELIELPGLHRDGREVPLGISFGEATIDGEHRFTAIIRDVSERAEYERERQATVDLLRELYDVTTDADLDLEDKVGLVLELGCEHLDMSYGFLSRIEPGDDGRNGRQRIVQAHGDHELLQPGESCPLDQAYCQRTIETDGLMAVADAVEDGWDSHPAYERFELGCYVGGKVLVDDGLYGTLCFASTSPRSGSFSDTDRTIVRIMSKWLGYELERRRVRKELERQNERLTEFAGILAHDLRNPMNVAKGRLSIAREERDSEDLERVADALDRMDELVDDVLTLTREGQAVTETESVDLASVAEQCWRTVDTAGAALVTETERSIRADPGSLQQLLENLVRNSIEHGDEDVIITVGDLDDGFFVADDGPGIPPEERDEVFESGYTTSEDGTGFGLAIVREIAGAHDWDVAVTESADGGARFEFTGVAFTDG